MMQLPALSPEERAYLRSMQPGSALQALAARLRQRLIAQLGVAVTVCESPGTPPQGVHSAEEPIIKIGHELAAAWLSVRLGGKPGTASQPFKDDSLIKPFRMLIARALAESAINLGEAVWPRTMCLNVSIGSQQGLVEIYWSNAHAVAWARRAIRESA
jgi:hypothetical protein